jgi:hypothetical protein
MHHPVEIDGCRLVILRERTKLSSVRYDVLESGFLVYDGETMLLDSENGSRVVTEQEMDDILDVTPTNQIPECSGFQLFILQRHD